MPKLKTLEGKIRYRIKRTKNPVFMLSDFDDLSDKDQVGRVLRNLIKKGLLVKAGQGVYVRAMISPFSQEPIPEEDSLSIALEVMEKRKIKTMLSRYEKMYKNGETTQFPAANVITIKGRCSRKIGFGKSFVSFKKEY